LEIKNKKTNQNAVNQTAYMFEAGLEYFISILITGAYLATVLSYNGVPDSVTGIITSLASFGFTAQALAVLFIHPKGKGKGIVVALHTLNQLMFALLYMTPFIKVSPGVKTVVFVVLFLGGHIFSNMAMPFKLSWLNSYVDDDKRGIYTAKKEISSLVGGIAFSYLMGGVSDYFKSVGKPDTAFLICGITVFVLCIGHTVSMLVVRDGEDAAVIQRQTCNFKDVLSSTLMNKDYRKIIWLDAIWHIATGIVGPFLGTYQINELGFSLTFVAFIAMLGSIARVLFSKFFGRYADRHSWAQMLTVVFFIGAIGYLFIVFATPSSGKIMYPLFLIVNGIYYAGSNSGIMNIAFDYTKHENRAAALGIKSAVGGIAGFLASLIGGEVVSMMQRGGNQIFGITIYAQQILAFVSFIAMMAVVFYIRKVIYKMNKII